MDDFNGLFVAVVTTTIRRNGKWNSTYRIDRVCDSMSKAWNVIEEVYNRFLREEEAFGNTIKFIIVHNVHSMIDGFESEVIDKDGKKIYFECSITTTRVN